MNESQKERLVMLAEEASEIIQAVSKILRHGYDSYHPNDLKKTSNKTLLENEIRDLNVIINQMIEKKDIDPSMELYEEDLIWKRKLQYTHHQDKSHE